MSWHQATVAVFPHCKATTPSAHLPISDVLVQIMCPVPEVQALIERIRMATTKAERDELKQHLPAATFSTDLHHRQGGTPFEDRLIAWSRVMQIDLDDLPDPGAVRTALRDDPFVAAVFLSPSGTGVKVLVLISDPARFADCWRAAAAYFSVYHGLTVDPAPKHPVSLCYLSWDPDLFMAEGEVAVFQPMAAEHPKVTKVEDPDPQAPLRPGDDFNRRGDVVAVLNRHGWTLERDGKNQHWRRPGKSAGLSATFNGSVFYVFSSNAEPFQANTGYARFAVYALLEHHGDFAAAATALRAQGFGEAKAQVSATNQTGTPAETPSPAVASEPELVVHTHADRMRERLAPPPMLIDGLLPVGGLGAIVAMPGAGKTLIAIEMTRCVASGEPFLGRQVTPGAVIYACPDSPVSTERRLLAIPESVGTHIHTVCDLIPLPHGMAALRRAVLKINATTPVRLLILDTWDSARQHASDGWAGQDALIEHLMRELRTLARELSLAVVVVHHATRQDHGRARGSVVFDARADWIAVAEGEDPEVLLRSIKCRDGERGAIGGFRIQPVDVGGKAVPTLVAMTPGDAEAPPPESSLQDRTMALLIFLVTHPGTHSAAELAGVLGLRGKGGVSVAIQDLRSHGLLEADSYAPTQAGVEAANEHMGMHWLKRPDSHEKHATSRHSGRSSREVPGRSWTTLDGREIPSVQSGRPNEICPHRPGVHTPIGCGLLDGRTVDDRTGVLGHQTHDPPIGTSNDHPPLTTDLDEYDPIDPDLCKEW